MYGQAIGAGANLLGGIIQSVAASRAKEEMEDEFRDQIDLQNRYRNQAFGTFEQATPFRGVETARDQIAEGSANREAFFGKTGKTRFGGAGGPNKRDEQAFALSAKNRADLGGYSDWALRQMIANIRTQDELNRISSFAGGRANVFPLQMEEASHAGDELAFWGKLIQSLGSGTGAFLDAGGAGPSAQYGVTNKFTGDINPGYFGQFSNVA